MKDHLSIDDLIQILSERSLSESERAHLNQLLRESPEAMDTWIDHCEMETWLAASGKRISFDPKSDRTLLGHTPNPVGSTKNERFDRAWKFGIGAIATICLLLGILLVSIPKPDLTKGNNETRKEPQPDAQIEDSRQDQYEKIMATIPVVGSQTRPPTQFENTKGENEKIDFNTDIRPILTENCIACHGPDEHGRKAKLRLDTFAGATAGDSPAIVAGESANSELISRIYTDDSDDIMPPPNSHKTLTETQKVLLERWIDEGANYEEHWAFVPPKDPIPTGENIGHPIDYLVEKNLASKNLNLSPMANKYTLARRVALDLTGVPLDRARIEVFVNDSEADSYERLVDELLSSTAYGEHRARYWLDAARYGDTHGLHLDNYREIWPYRDWVINAYNQNLPFDQFTIEQLAGDLLPEPSQSQLVATGFNRCNVMTSEGGAIDEEFYTRYAVDRVSTTSTVWMGLTAGCAQCHDHKFDPLTMKEFYQLYAFFNNTTQRAMDGNIKDTPPIIPVYPDDQTEREAAQIKTDIRALEKQFQESKNKTKFDRWLSKISPTELDSFSKNSLHNRDQPKVEVPDIPSVGVNHPFTIDLNYALPIGASAKLFTMVDSKNQNRGIRIYVEQERINVELIESWPNQMLRIGAGRSFKSQARGRLTVVYDGGKSSKGIRLYVNGQRFTSRYVSEWVDTLDSDFNTSAAAYIGDSLEKPALISNFQFYDKAMSEEEIVARGQLSTVKTIIKKPLEKHTQKETQELEKYYFHLFDANSTAKLAELEMARQKLRRLQFHVPTTLVMNEKDEAPKAYILERGEYDLKGEEVSPAFPAFIENNSKEPNDSVKNRLDLARWLTDPSHPLTSRVIVNRVWQELFGRGLVKTSEDFGTQGESPSNPELLDYLAIYFVRSGWDVKNLYKHILTSRVYQQQSAASPELISRDPNNIWLARGPRFRLDAEVIRDQALSSSHLLSPIVGGPSVKPYQPNGLWQTVGYTNSNTQTFFQDFGSKTEHRRSLYSFWKRTAPPPNMSIFDAPDRESCTVRRERTNTPLQALVLMNDPQFLRASRHLAMKTVKEHTDATSRIEAIGYSLLGRPFDSQEIELITHSLQKFRDSFSSNPESARQLLIDEVNPSFSISGESHLELASWTMVASQIMNLDESLTKN